jgi:hypothetical protein
VPPREPPESPPPASWLVVGTARNGEPVYEAGWRYRLPDGRLRTMKRRLGAAWLARDDSGELRRRRGRPKPEYLDEHAAIVAKDQLVREVERELAERAAAAERAGNAPPTFRAVANAYLDWLERGRGDEEGGWLEVEGEGGRWRAGVGRRWRLERVVLVLLGDRCGGGRLLLVAPS